MKIIIIGSGPTALGAAYRLAELNCETMGHQVLIFEENSQVGGLAKSIKTDDGFIWDMGGHVLFSHYQYFDRVVDKAIGEEWNVLRRASYVVFNNGRFIPYPLQHNIDSLDEQEQELCITGFKNRITKDIKNFDDWLLTNFGEGLCNMFMRKYNRKIWSVDPTEMNHLWVGERVALPTIPENTSTKTNSISGTSKQGDKGWGPNATFKFPKRGGTGSIWNGISKMLPQSWIKLNTRVTNIDMDKKVIRVTNQENGISHDLKYDILINTMPLDLLIQQINQNLPKQVLSISDKFIYASTHIIGIGLHQPIPEFLKDKTWMYFPEDNCPFYRVSVFSNYSDNHTPDPLKYWSLMCECSDPQNHKRGQELINQTIDALVNYGFIQLQQVVSKSYQFFERGYPVPFLKREEILNKIQPQLEKNNIYSRGRFGGWKYEVSNQDHSFMQGVEVVNYLFCGIPEITYPNPNVVNSGYSNSILPPLIKSYPKYEIIVSHSNDDNIQQP